MRAPYSYAVLPLDTPDDDPIWTSYVNIFRTVFLDSRAADEGVATFRAHRREDGAVLGMVTTEGPGLDGRQPVAAFNVARNTINHGRGLQPVLIVNTIGVLPSHRRRGLLKEMMRRQLDAARDDGVPVAVLTASEATIYGRFGFGPVGRGCELKIDTRRFGYRDGVTVAGGSVEFVDPSFLNDHWKHLTSAHQAAHRGAVGHQHVHLLLDTGAWDSEAAGPSKSLRAAVHFDEEGTPDGFALFRFKGWEESSKAEVFKVCAADPAVARALWKALAEMDLIETLLATPSTLPDHLILSLADSRAAKVAEVGDGVWLRLLDLPAAVEGRAFDADGEVVLRVTDAMGYVNGVWRLSAEDGVGRVERSDEAAEVTLAADVLATLWHGDRTASQAAAAGLVEGSPEAVRRLGRLLRWDESTENLAAF